MSRLLFQSQINLFKYYSRTHLLKATSILSSSTPYNFYIFHGEKLIIQNDNILQNQFYLQTRLHSFIKNINLYKNHSCQPKKYFSSGLKINKTSIEEEEDDRDVFEKEISIALQTLKEEDASIDENSGLLKLIQDLNEQGHLFFQGKYYELSEQKFREALRISKILYETTERDQSEGNEKDNEELINNLNLQQSQDFIPQESLSRLQIAALQLSIVSNNLAKTLLDASNDPRSLILGPNRSFNHHPETTTTGHSHLNNQPTDTQKQRENWRRESLQLYENSLSMRKQFFGEKSFHFATNKQLLGLYFLSQQQEIGLNYLFEVIGIVKDLLSSTKNTNSEEKRYLLKVHQLGGSTQNHLAIYFFKQKKNHPKSIIHFKESLLHYKKAYSLLQSISVPSSSPSQQDKSIQIDYITVARNLSICFSKSNQISLSVLFLEHLYSIESLLFDHQSTQLLNTLNSLLKNYSKLNSNQSNTDQDLKKEEEFLKSIGVDLKYILNLNSNTKIQNRILELNEIIEQIQKSHSMNKV